MSVLGKFVILVCDRGGLQAIDVATITPSVAVAAVTAAMIGMVLTSQLTPLAAAMQAKDRSSFDSEEGFDTVSPVRGGNTAPHKGAMKPMVIILSGGK